MHGKGKFPWPCLLSSWNSDVDGAIGMGVLPLAVLLAVRRRQKIDFELGFYVDGNDSSEAVEFPEWTPKDSSMARPSAPGLTATSTLGRSTTRQDARQGKVSLAVPLVVLELRRRRRHRHGCTPPCRASCRQTSPKNRLRVGFLRGWQ